MIAASLPVVLGGCSTMESLNPVNWWHQSEGGKIAEERPAPPGSNDPYPNLAQVPPRPTPPDREAMKRLTDGLIADRQHAQHTAATNPLTDPSLPGASPNLFGARTLPPPGPGSSGAASASLAAASAPPAPAAVTPRDSNEPPPPPAPAPVKPVASTPLAAPAPAAPAQAAPAPAAVPPAPPAASPAPAMPPIAAEPPPRPALAASPPPPAAVAPVSATPAPQPAATNAMTLDFAPGSAALESGPGAAIKALAKARQAQIVVVTGYGEAASSDPGAQASAMGLAMTRAQTVVDALKAAGVPASAIRAGGEAAGRGVNVRLLQ